MKKFNVLLLSVVALGMSVVSCSKDDKNDDALKVPMGKWVYDKISQTSGGKTSQEQNFNNASCDDLRYLNFKDSKSLEDGYVDTDCVLTPYQGTYTQKGNDVKIVESDGLELNYTLVSVTPTKLTVKQLDVKDSSIFYTITFNKQ